tara:strand:- start:633 stop:881 length:249 start_codon:yes stop_codon:yes gene_type:complete
MTQEELFPDLRHDSTYSYEDDTGTDEWYGKNARLMTTEFIKHYEYYDSDGERRVRKVTEKKTYFKAAEMRHNPACSTCVEIL